MQPRDGSASRFSKWPAVSGPTASQSSPKRYMTPGTPASLRLGRISTGSRSADGQHNDRDHPPRPGDCTSRFRSRPVESMHPSAVTAEAASSGSEARGGLPGYGSDSDSVRSVQCERLAPPRHDPARKAIDSAARHHARLVHQRRRLPNRVPSWLGVSNRRDTHDGIVTADPRLARLCARISRRRARPTTGERLALGPIELPREGRVHNEEAHHRNPYTDTPVSTTSDIARRTPALAGRGLLGDARGRLARPRGRARDRTAIRTSGIRRRRLDGR